MKKLLTSLVSLFLIVSLGSCDKVKELADIDFDANFSTPSMTINPSMAKTDGGYNFTVNSNINPLSNVDVKKYLSKIKKWKVNSIEIEIISVSEPGTYLTKDTKLEMQGSKNKASVTINEDTKIFEGYKYKVPSAVYKKVEKILNDKEDFDIKFDGGLNNNATVVMKVNIDVTITANPL